MTQADRTEIVILDAGITGHPGRHQLQLDALHAHARELARKLDAVGGLAKADMHKRLGIQDYQSALRDIRAIVEGE